MTGLPIWDALIWAVIGIIGGTLLAVKSSPRAAMIFALVVAVVGFLMVPLMLVIFGEDGPGYALMVLFWSVPTTLGLALGTALSKIFRKD